MDYNFKIKKHQKVKFEKLILGYNQINLYNQLIIFYKVQFLNNSLVQMLVL